MTIENILITDDHALLIDGIIATLKELFTINNVVVCYTPEKAIEKAKEQNFDLYILDLGFRSDSNVDIRRLDYIREISATNKQAKIIVYTMREDFGMINLLCGLDYVKGVVMKGPE